MSAFPGLNNLGVAPVNGYGVQQSSMAMLGASMNMPSSPVGSTHRSAAPTHTRTPSVGTIGRPTGGQNQSQQSPSLQPVGVGSLNALTTGTSPPMSSGRSPPTAPLNQPTLSPTTTTQQYGNMNGSSSGIGVETPQSRTLWIGDIDAYMDENFLHSLFAHTCEVTQVKVIRDKNTGLSAGYGFVEFANHFAAKQVLESHNGQPLPTGSGKVYRLNWASYGINERRADAAGPEYSLFVGDLAPEVNDFILQQTFAERYKTIKSAKVVTDSQTGMSRRYGFVRFYSEEEMHRALVDMQGELCAGRPMRINHATPRRQDNQNGPANGPQPFERPEIPESADPNNTTVFIGNLDSSVNEEDLKTHFEPYGEMIYVKIPIGKGCGFVQFTHRKSAEAAFEKHGCLIGRQRVRLSWGRSSKKSQQTRTPFPGTTLRPQTISAPQTQTPAQVQSQYDMHIGRAQSPLMQEPSMFSGAFGGFGLPNKISSTASLQAQQLQAQQLRQQQQQQLQQHYYGGLDDPTLGLQSQLKQLQLSQQMSQDQQRQQQQRHQMQQQMLQQEHHMHQLSGYGQHSTSPSSPMGQHRGSMSNQYGVNQQVNQQYQQRQLPQQTQSQGIQQMYQSQLPSSSYGRNDVFSNAFTPQPHEPLPGRGFDDVVDPFMAPFSASMASNGTGSKSSSSLSAVGPIGSPARSPHNARRALDNLASDGSQQSNGANSSAANGSNAQANGNSSSASSLPFIGGPQFAKSSRVY